MQRLVYIILRLFVFLFTLLPFKVLYWLSDGLRFLFYYLIRYRYGVIKSNLESAFPKKNDKEIQQLIWDSYRNLTDILLEGIKGLGMSKVELDRRYQFVNPEILDQYYKQKKSVIILASHFGNWEWGARAVGHNLKHHTLGITAPIKNVYIHNYLESIRNSVNVTTAQMNATASAFEEFKNKTMAYVIVIDQSPRNTRKAFWFDFLNQKTAFFHGGDKYARQTSYPVFFALQKRVKRGHYNVELQLIEENNTPLEEGKVMRQYVNHLEKMILQDPESWLWSHRRWKHKFENQLK